MVIIAKLNENRSVEVRIENGQISEMHYQGMTEQRKVRREETDYMEMWLKDIMKADVEKFKEIFKNIPQDEEFTSYGKKLLDTEKQKKVKALLEYRKECDRRLAQLEKEVERYSI